MINCVQSFLKNPPTFRGFSSSVFRQNVQTKPYREPTNFKYCINRRFLGKRRVGIVCGGLLPVDPWSPTIDSQSVASQLFALSLFPYIGFLYFITKSKSAPKLTLFGFYFLLAFVGATIPAGIYAKVHYGTSLSNVDWLHGGAESLLTLTNLFIVMGLREGLRKTGNAKPDTSSVVSGEEEDSSI
ncbi:Undecaprenyl-diphosphatase [Actinidia chinensis var. chinensis]|uniref:Undecaprenyl-diphosphatase n=1 Tax=Actinidia chinensis var. chinensis TaxID=1590841 RepID=A0A2R6PHT8_ACTCC|nr:Undecaprenyl-diphosphatase [Actinidia chinensis var. chinensis]